MQTFNNSFLYDIAELSESIQPRRKSLIDRLIGQLAAGQIRGADFLYEVHGPFVVSPQLARPCRSLFAQSAEAFRTFLLACSRWQECRRAQRDISRLDDRTLRDIGLTRCDIEAAARGVLRRDVTA